MNTTSNFCSFFQNFNFIDPIYKECDQNKIKIYPDSFLESRTNLIEMTKKLIYKQFKNQVIKETDHVFIHYGVNKSSLGQDDFENFFKEKSQAIEEVESMLLIDSFSVIEHTQEIKEKEEKKRLLSNFIKNIDKKNWYFFCFQADPESKIMMMQDLNDKLVKLLFIANIADYLGLLLMELAQNAEKSHYEMIAKKYFNPTDLEDFIKDKANRKKIRQLIQEKKEFLKLEIELIVNNDFNKLIISLTNKGFIHQDSKNLIIEKMNRNNSQKSLSDYYQESENKLGAGLGLFYVSYIKEESENNGLIFNAFIESLIDQEEVKSSFELVV